MNLQYLKGVGPARAEILNKMGLYTVDDLINYFPRDYEDRGVYKKICELQDGETVTFNAFVASNITENRIRRNMSIYKAVVKDETGSAIVTWFNQAYIKKQIRVGVEYSFYGKVKNTLGRIEMQSPVFEEVNTGKNTGKIIPKYPLIYGITQNVFRGIIENAMAAVEGTYLDSLPSWVLEKEKLADINWCLRNIHFPMTLYDFEKARYRIAYEELLTMALGLLRFKEKGKTEYRGIKFTIDEKMQDFVDSLPYNLTNAQYRVWQEIDKDMKDDKSMNRLVQGDVGSGKTVVATMAMYKAVKNGYQATLMAPTAILAKQHYEGIKKMLEPFHIKVELLTGDVTKKNKGLILEALKNGEIDILIGTHALLEENVEFANVGLVITDEQHRFGVRQRGILSSKGQKPDTLVMTATPIPRTLAIILYGDLDISIIDELPPGRQKIDTYAVRRNMEMRVNEFIRKEMQSGRQAYIVCPLVEESENMDGVKSVTEQLEYYQEVFHEFHVEMLHGKMRPKEKDEIMLRFKNGEIDALISTTVIEVGVDVPNATIMVVENAERFGLAQLHQLRGRVGRGKYKSYCILKYDSKSDVVRQRMEIMQKSNDGFVISEKDLELRGPGDFFGTMQHGLPEFRVANLFTDMAILKKAQAVAGMILERDPELMMEENHGLSKKIDKLFEEKISI
ncbi:MAG: ATP-dependent DNA helicase RecG [Clostridia bacterium]|nr:ATP-dependent DNA helicase RecG [Clostridia bacterium]